MPRPSFTDQYMKSIGTLAGGIGAAGKALSEQERQRLENERLAAQDVRAGAQESRAATKFEAEEAQRRRDSMGRVKTGQLREGFLESANKLSESMTGDTRDFQEIKRNRAKNYESEAKLMSHLNRDNPQFKGVTGDMLRREDEKKRMEQEQAIADEATKVGRADEKFDLSKRKIEADIESTKAGTALKRKQTTLAGTTKPKAAKEAKSSQYQAATFGRRIELSEAIFDKLVAEGFDRTSKASAAASALPEGTRTSMRKQQDQAERNFINATLRRESGAAISPSEFENAEMQYLPRVGDSKEVLDQKRQNRMIVMQGMKAESGTAWDQVQLPGTEQEMQIGTVEDGYRYKGGDKSDPNSWEKV